MRLKVARDKGKNMNLWLPLFLFWPGMGFLAVACTFLLLPVSILYPRKISIKKSFLGPAWLLLMFCRLRGFKIYLEEKKQNKELLLALI